MALTETALKALKPKDRPYIFLRYADKRFTELTAALIEQGTPEDEIDAVDYQAEGVLYLPEEARFSYLLKLTEGANLGKAIGQAMALVEEHDRLASQP